MEKNENMIKEIFCEIEDLLKYPENYSYSEFNYNEKITLLKISYEKLLGEEDIYTEKFYLEEIASNCFRFMIDFYSEKQRKEFYKFLDLNKDNEKLLSKEYFNKSLGILSNNIELTAKLGKELDDDVYTGSEREKKDEDYKFNIDLISLNCIFLLYLINQKVV